MEENKPYRDLDMNNPIVRQILTGGVIPNPAYDPKKKGTKNKPAEPQYIVDRNLKAPDSSIWDRESNAAQKLHYDNTDLGLTPGQFHGYREYGATPGPYKTIEDLNRTRAENQSVTEKVSRMVGQAVGNEVLIGSALGLSNLIDAGINLPNTLGITDGANDYSNPVSQYLKNAQNNIREEWEIYRRNPDEAFALKDFGWWASNMVSIASTASMLIPSVGVTRGLSLLGKVGKGAGQISHWESGAYQLAKIAEKANLAKNPATLARAISQGTQIGNTALMSRTMEGYLEARGVYNEVKENAKDRLASMSEQEKVQFVLNNPQIAGMDDDQIAEYMAGSSADDTFRRGYLLTLLDAAQFKAIPGLWKATPNSPASSAIRRLNKQKALELAGRSDEAIALATTRGKLLESARHYKKNPFAVLAGIELLEGVEEGYQGIIGEKGKEVAEKMFDPNYSEKDIISYMADPHIWEQAFWGVLGGVGFKGIGKGFSYAENQISARMDKKKLSDEEFALRLMGQDKIKAAEIEGRADLIKVYKEKMESLNRGINPDQFVIDPITKQPVLDAGVGVRQTVSKEEADDLKSMITNEFVTNMVLNSVEAGNFDLLKEYIENSDFDKAFKEVGINTSTGDKSVSQILNQKMNQVYEVYSKSLYDVMGSVNVENPAVAKIIARNIARNRLSIDDLNQGIANIDRAISEDSDNGSLTADYEESVRIKSILDSIKELDNISRQLNNLNPKTSGFSVQAIDARNKEINREKRRLMELASTGTTFGLVENIQNALRSRGIDANSNQFLSQFNKFVEDNNARLFSPNSGEFRATPPKKSLQDLIERKVKLDNQRSQLEFSIPETQSEFQEEYNEFARSVDRLTRERLEKAAERVKQYIEAHDDVNAAYENIMSNNVTEDLQRDLDLLKLGHDSTVDFYTDILATANIVQRDRAEKEREAKIIKSDAQILKEKQAEEERLRIANAEALAQEELARAAIVQQQDEEAASSTDGNNSSTGEIVPAAVVATADPNTAALNVTEAVAQLDAASSAEQRAIGTFYAPTEDERAPSLASDIVFDLFRTDRPAFENLEGKSVKDVEFQTILDAVVERLINQGVSQGVARGAAIEGLKISLNIIHNATRERKMSSAETFKRLADEVAVMQRINVEDGDSRNAITTPVPDEQVNSVIKEFIDSYIKAKKLIAFDGSKSIIDVNKLFEYILDEAGVSYDQAKHIFYNIHEYINNSNDFIFINKRSLNNNLRTPNQFFKELEDAKTETKNIAKHIHTSPPTQAKQYPGYAMNISLASSGSPVTIVDRGGSLSFRMNKNDVKSEVAYLATVESSNTTGTGYRLRDQDRGFVYQLDEVDGVINSNFDELFNYLINRDSLSDKDKSDADRLFVLAQKQKLFNENNKHGVVGTPLSANEAKEVIENPLVAKLIQQGLIIFPKNDNNDHHKGIRVASQLGNVLFHSGLETDQGIMDLSYSNWKVEMFENYKQTHALQNALAQSIANGTDLTISLSGKTNKGVLRSSESRDIASAELGFTDDNSIVIVDESGALISENGDTYPNTARFSSGTMGLSIANTRGAPIIALFTDSNPLSSNSDLAFAVRKELVDLFTGFKQGYVSYEQLYDILPQLFSGPGVTGSNLFSGYSVVRSTERIALNLQGQKGKYNLIINKNKAGSSEVGNEMIYIPNGGDIPIGPVLSDKVIGELADEIVKNLSFNRTFYPVKNKNVKDDTRTNRYIKKENGNLVIHIGSRVETDSNGNRVRLVQDDTKKRVYKNFTEFVLKNNAFKTNQGVNKGMSGIEKYFDNFTDTSELYFDVDSLVKPSDNILRTQTASTFTQLVTKDGTKTPTGKDKTRGKNQAINTREALAIAGIKQDEIDVLAGHNVSSIPLIPRHFYFDNAATNTNAYYEDGKIYISNRGVTRVRNNGAEIKRLLIHEQLHHRFTSIDPQRRDEVISQLLETYNDFIESLDSAPNTEQNAKIKQWVSDTFNLDTYIAGHINTLKGKAKSNFAALPLEQQREAILPIFAEEWLVESLSNRPLVKYLNDTKLANETIVISNITPENKTLFQRVIEALMQLFNLDNINDSSILAKQYSILGDIATVDDASTSKVESDKDTNDATNTTGEDPIQDSTPSDTPSDTTNEPVTREQRERELRGDTPKRRRRDRLNSIVEGVQSVDEVRLEAYNSNPTINPNGLSTISNMNTFIDGFDNTVKPQIAEMINSNKIKFVCQ